MTPSGSDGIAGMSILGTEVGRFRERLFTAFTFYGVFPFY